MTATQHIGPLGSGVTKTFTTVSDWLGRPVSSTNPDNETLAYNYDALGRPSNFRSDSYQSIIKLQAYPMMNWAGLPPPVLDKPLQGTL